jgi:hypothetical protein
MALDLLAHERQHDMKKAFTKMDDQNIPELTREQLGQGVRGKYFQQFTQGSNVVALRPEIQKAFPNSQAVNTALAHLLAFTKTAQELAVRPARRRLTAA